MIKECLNKNAKRRGGSALWHNAELLCVLNLQRHSRLVLVVGSNTRNFRRNTDKGEQSVFCVSPLPFRSGVRLYLFVPGESLVHPGARFAILSSLVEFLHFRPCPSLPFHSWWRPGARLYLF
eukprot:Hpha_TRINITY_DN27995_c0_g1::TRINITY_DN27995_c0_g1_i1::g.45062::m.45062